MKQIRKTFFAVLCLIAYSGSASAIPFSDLYIFGDSLSDTGNVSIVAEVFFGADVPLSPPYAEDRFSNGPVWVETLSVMLGLGSVIPTVSGQVGGPPGNNYSYGGARVTSAGDVPTLETQAQDYLGNNVADPNALYIVWGGGNDIRSNDAATPNAAGDIVSIVQGLVNAGAHNILVPNLPDIGFTPEALFGLTPGCSNLNPGESCSDRMSMLTGDHNTALAAGLAGISGGNVMLFDVANIFAMLLNDAAAFEFDPAVTGLPCYQGQPQDTSPAPTCTNPEDYIFWDGIHPTADAHRILGEMAFSQVVPIPAAVWLFGSALIGLIGVRRRS